MGACFISDLHLGADNFEVNDAFINWLADITKEIDALYILGDFFDSWSNLELDEAWCQKIISALRHASCMIDIYVLPGNHDFLLDEQFASQANISLLLGDDVLIKVAEKNIILLHGDTLVADDLGYKVFRKLIRSKLVLSIYHNISTRYKQFLVRKIKTVSRGEGSAKSFVKIDDKAIVKLHAKYCQADMMICGHFHVAMNETIDTAHGRLQLFVLAAWERRFMKSSARFVFIHD